MKIEQYCNALSNTKLRVLDFFFVKKVNNFKKSIVVKSDTLHSNIINNLQKLNKNSQFGQT